MFRIAPDSSWAIFGLADYDRTQQRLPFPRSGFWFILDLAPPPFGEVLGVWWATHSVEVTGWAAAAAAQDKCLALKVGATGNILPKPSIGVTPEHYTDGCA